MKKTRIIKIGNKVQHNEIVDKLIKEVDYC